MGDKKGLSEEVTSPQKRRPRGSQACPDPGKEPGRGHGMCKGPEAEALSVSLESSQPRGSSLEKRLDFQIRRSRAQVRFQMVLLGCGTLDRSPDLSVRCLLPGSQGIE